MPNYNKVILIGHLSRDPETRIVGEHTVTNFTLAVNSGYGEKKRVAFVDVEAWNKRGEVVEQYCQKGSALMVEGEILQDNWEDQQGNNRSKLKVAAREIVLMPKGSGSSSSDRNDKPDPTTSPTTTSASNAGFDSGDDEPPF